jgi:hypothetical protein
MIKNEIENPVAKKKNEIKWDVAGDRNKKIKKGRKNKSSGTYQDSVFNTSSTVRKILIK